MRDAANIILPDNGQKLPDTSDCARKSCTDNGAIGDVVGNNGGCCERCHGTGVLYRQDTGAHGLTLPCPNCLIDEYDDFEDPDDDDLDEWDDCGLMANGQCSKAGSEECDWFCGGLR